MDPAWMSMPPVIITKVTNREMMQTGMNWFSPLNRRLMLRNFGLSEPNTTNSSTMISTRNVSQRTNSFFTLFIGRSPLPLDRHVRVLADRRCRRACSTARLRMSASETTMMISRMP
jgi:hypothetical protein